VRREERKAGRKEGRRKSAHKTGTRPGWEGGGWRKRASRREEGREDAMEKGGLTKWRYWADGPKETKPQKKEMPSLRERRKEGRRREGWAGKGGGMERGRRRI